MTFVLTRRIMKAYGGGDFVGAVIYGSQRIGKSSYALQVLHQVYEDWDRVLKYCLFDLRDVVNVLSDAVKKDVKIPALIWDDAGVHGNKMLYFSNRRLVEYLSDLLDVVGTHLGGLLITTPSPAKLLRVIRGYEFYRIKIFRRDESYGRIAVGYRLSLYPSGAMRIRRVFRDEYRVKIPDDVWDEYQKKRKSYLNVALKNLGKYLKGGQI